MPKRDRKHRNGQGKVSAKLKKWFDEGSKEISLFMLVPSDSELNQVRSFLNKDLKIRLNSANQWFFVISFPAFDAEVAPILPYYTQFYILANIYTNDEDNQNNNSLAFSRPKFLIIIGRGAQLQWSSRSIGE